MAIRDALLALERDLERLIERRRFNRLEAYSPYAKQREFHDAGKTHRERLLRAGNQLGKCATVRSLIDTPSGPVRLGDLVERAQPFEVLSWDGEQAIRAWASAPFRKPGAHHCYRITMADGQWIEAADCHLVLTVCGWRWLSGCLPRFGLVHPESSLGLGPLTHGADDQDSSRTPLDFLERYSPDSRLCDGQPHAELENVRAWFPSQSDVRQHSLLWLHSDDHRPERTNIARPDSGHPSNWGGHLSLSARCAESSDAVACRSAQWSLHEHLGGERSRLASVVAPQSSFAGWTHVQHETVGETYGPCDVLTPIAGNHIISVEYIGRHDVYDFEVHGWHNYLAGGMINHNTLAGAAEVAMHITGLYPQWWQGRRFERPTKWWAGSKSGEATRGGVQRLLMGEPGDPSALGSGFIPRDFILDTSPARGLADALDTVVIRNVHSGSSVLKFKSYEQGRERWQVETVDGVWFDEEPPEDVYTEGLSRTNATGGLVFLTFTPLLGVSNVVMRFIREKSPDRSDTVMTIDDVEHISAEEKARIIASYPEHEREARTRGVPILGSGRIFPLPRALLSVDPFPLPEWWARIGGLDFGWDHPTAAVCLAHDRDSDTIYVTHAWRQSQVPVHTVAAALKPWGAIPWAWPHDGLNATAGSPDPLASQYRRSGLEMRPEPASYSDERRNQVEAGIMDMLDRMHTGRFKVFSHLNDWFEEFDLFHRKDGKVVKERDDLMAATRYAVMDVRFARALAEAPVSDRYARRRFRGDGGGSAWAA